MQDEEDYKILQRKQQTEFNKPKTDFHLLTSFSLTSDV